MYKPVLTANTIGFRFGNRALFAVAVFGSLAGCATYRPKPLDAHAVEQALQPAKMESVKVAAAQLKHSLIKPLIIDGREGFSPDEIAVIAVIASPALNAARAQRGVTKAQLLQAGLLPNPQLSASFDRVVPNGDPTLVNGSSVGVSWDITALLAHHDGVVAARATADALDLTIAWQEWQAAEDARLRAFRVLSLEERLVYAKRIEKDLAQAVTEMEGAVALRLRVETELFTAQESWRKARTDRFALEQQIIADRAALNLALGRPADTALKIRPAPNFPVLPKRAAEGFRQGMEERRLDLVALKLGYASQEAALRAAVKSQFPRINLSLARAKDTSDIRTHSIGIIVDIPLFDRGQGQIAVAQATRQQLFDEYIARVAEAHSQVDELLAEIDTARTELATVDATLPALEKTAKAFENAVAERSVDVSAYRDALAAAAARRIERSQLQQSLIELGIGLEIVTGRPLLNR